MYKLIQMRFFFFLHTYIHTENGNVRFEQKLMNSRYDTLHCSRPDPKNGKIQFKVAAFNKWGTGYSTSLQFVNCGKFGMFCIYLVSAMFFSCQKSYSTCNHIPSLESKLISC